MSAGGAAIVGAAESTRLGVLPDISQIQLHADAARNAMADAGLGPADIDGLACANENPVDVAYYLGIVPSWVDGTYIGGCSFLAHVRHAAAAIATGLCRTVLIVHGESGRSGVGLTRPNLLPSMLRGQFEQPFGVVSPATVFTIPALRYMKHYGVSEEQLATVAVVQRQWAIRNPRAFLRSPITVDEVLASKMIAYPFRAPMCCLVTDGGGALIVTANDRAADFPKPPVYLLGGGESTESPMLSQMLDFTSSRSFRLAGETAFRQAGVTHGDVDHLMIYDAFAHLPLYGLEDLGFVERGEAAAFIAEGATAPGGRLPVNTNGGGLSYMHSGTYGMYALQESVRQLRGEAAAQVPHAEVGVCHGVGGMFAAAVTLVLSRSPPHRSAQIA